MRLITRGRVPATAERVSVRPWFERLTDEDNHWLQAGVADSEGDHALAERLYERDAEVCASQGQPARAGLSCAFAARNCTDPGRRRDLFQRAGAAFEAAATAAMRDNPWLAYQFLVTAAECHGLAGDPDAIRRVEQRRTIVYELIDPR